MKGADESVWQVPVSKVSNSPDYSPKIRGLESMNPN